ncbi:E3 ubiquitin-protein ligase CCNB1IP1 [Termitomyces sp. T112]|nr:E3 ubiquitin-protein ligase CCNB1IP1 [Termitomyces sp. T112]
MDINLKCNRLTCRQPLTDKAVVTTCSHIFCVGCASELFNSARLCPACDTSLTEPDDVVVCSLQPSNDYKTSVLSGLTPSTILEICSRALSFWQYQIFQENSFQQAVVRNLNDKNAQLQKQLENVVREANGEISLLNGKAAELERDLELERRKIHELQDTSRDREKEYQKLKLQLDKFKRKALLSSHPNDNLPGFNPNTHEDQPRQQPPRPFGMGITGNANLGAVVGGMEASGIQRTPLVNRTMSFAAQAPVNTTWGQQQTQHGHIRNRSHRQPFAAPTERSYRSTTDHSDSANEVENILITNQGANRGQAHYSGWSSTPQQVTNVQGFPNNSATRRNSNKFRPVIPNGR